MGSLTLRRGLPALLVVLLAASFAAGCGGGSGSSAAASSGPASGSSATGGPASTARAGSSAKGEATSQGSSPAATGSGSAGDAGTAGTGADLALKPGADGCDHRVPPTAEGDRRQYDSPPPSGLPGDANATVTFETSCGAIKIQLDRTVGGAVTDAFAGLVRDGFYDGLTFHRVVPDFVLQGGDPEGTGAGGPGFTVTQAPPVSYVYAKGDVAMAKLPSDAAGTAGSQFFIAVSPQGAAGLAQPGQPPLYAVVGHVLDQPSLATVSRIAALGVDDGPPLKPVYIWRATLAEG